MTQHENVLPDRNSAEFEKMRAALDQIEARSPIGVRVAADITVLLLSIFLIVSSANLMIVEAPGFLIVELFLTLLLIGVVIRYRAAKKWAYFFICGLFALNVGIWIYSVFVTGMPLELGRLAVTSIVPVVLIGVGAANWSQFEW
jgi:hypothetical protein